MTSLNLALTYLLKFPCLSRWSGEILIIKEFNKAFELVPSIKLLPLIQIKIQNVVNKIESNTIHAPSENFVESDLNHLKEGMKIEHKKFGYGLIKSIDKTQNHQKAIVNFKLVGEKTLLLSFAKLRIVK